MVLRPAMRGHLQAGHHHLTTEAEEVPVSGRDRVAFEVDESNPSAEAPVIAVDEDVKADKVSDSVEEVRAEVAEAGSVHAGGFRC